MSEEKAKKKKKSPGIGHNSGVVESDAGTQDVGGVSGKRLKQFFDRIERLEEERKEVGDDIKEIYAEAKGAGFDVKTMRRIMRLRKMDPEKRAEAEAIEELYKSAIGMG